MRPRCPISTHDPSEANAVERWCNQVAAELLVPMAEFRTVFDRARIFASSSRPLAEHFRVSTQVILGRIREAGALTWDELPAGAGHPNAVASQCSSPSGVAGGNYYNTKPVQVSKRFARAIVASALEGQTSYTEAFRLLGLKKAATFDGAGRAARGAVMAYLLDSNVLIAAKNNHYGFDFCPAFWDVARRVATLPTGSEASKRVYDELIERGDELSDWARDSSTVLPSAWSAEDVRAVADGQPVGQRLARLRPRGEGRVRRRRRLVPRRTGQGGGPHRRHA